MPSDQDYLQSAGVQDGAAPQVETPAPEQPKTPEQTAQEMFELNGNKFPVTSEFQFAHGGKNLKVPYNSLINTYRQAAHMQDKWAEFKKVQQEQAEKLQSYDRYKGFYDKYGALQEWSEKNPDQWNTLHELWKNRDQHLLSHQLQSNPNTGFDPSPIVKELASLKSELGDYRQWKADQERRAAEEKDNQNVEFIKGQVQTFAKEYPDIDITEKDPDGVPLWSKIVTWGDQNRYPDFESAALVYLKQRIVDSVKNQARTEAMKSAKQEHKEGIVKRSATPFSNGQGPAINKKNLSYAELADLAKSGQFQTGT